MQLILVALIIVIELWPPMGLTVSPVNAIASILSVCSACVIRVLL